MYTYYQSLIYLAIFFIALISIIFYVYVFPRKKPNLLILLIFISLLPMVSLLRHGVYESGDFTIHVYEAISFYSNIIQGVLIPRWGGELNATYGYPVFIFAYPAPNYLIAAIHSFGFSFVSSIKIFILFTFVGSGITMYFFIKNYIGKFEAFVAGILYLYSPYHIIATHYRVAIGEMLAMTLLPIVLLTVTKSINNQKQWNLACSFSVALLVLSHQAISLIFFTFLLFFTIFNWKILGNSSKHLLKTLSYIIFGIGIATYYWLPVIYEKQFTLQGIDPGTVSFSSIASYIYSPYFYGFLYQGLNGELTPIIGYSNVIIILISLYLLTFKKYLLDQNTKLKLVFYLTIFFIIFIMLLPVSKPVWDTVPLINNFQFAYRIISIITVLCSILGALIIKYFNKKIIILFLVLSIFITFLNWGNRRTIPTINDITLANNLPFSTAEAEGNIQSITKWVNKNDIWFHKLPKAHLEILKGSGEVANIYRSNQNHSYIVNAKTNLEIKENTLYFPGWNIYVNNIKSSDYSIANDGTTLIKLESGKYLLSYNFENTFIRNLGEAISLASIIFVIYLFFIENKNRFYR